LIGPSSIQFGISFVPATENLDRMRELVRAAGASSSASAPAASRTWWRALAARNGRRGSRFEALDEAIDVVRLLWS
jgi:hypothetical protein